MEYGSRYRRKELGRGGEGGEGEGGGGRKGGMQLTNTPQDFRGVSGIGCLE